MSSEQRIGQLALEMAEGPVDRLMVYAEVEDGVISADVFYALPLSEMVRFRFAPPALQQEVYSFWEDARHRGNQEWRTMTYVVADGRFTIDLQYEDQVNAGEALHDRRPRAVSKHFGDAKVDYSRP